MGRANVTGKGFAHVSISHAVAAKIAAFIETNEWGYRSRAEVVTAAIREFVEGERFTRGDLRRALQSVAAAHPKNVEDLLDSLIAELDLADDRDRSGVGGDEFPRDPNRGRPASKRLAGL